MFEPHHLDDILAFDSHDFEIGDLDGQLTNHVASPWDHDGRLIYGTPDTDVNVYELQTTPFTCAVVSQQMILRSFGIEVSEAELVYDATSHGWLTDHGTEVADVGKLLEMYGIGTHTRHGATVEELAAELAHGHKVILSLDSGELSGSDLPFEDWLNPHGVDHALVVTGLDLSDSNHPMAIVNDPGDPHGCGRHYPLDKLLNAWNDSGNMYLATDHSPAELASHPILGANFHDETGLYLDSQFWMNLITTVVDSDAGEDIRRLLEDVSQSEEQAARIEFGLETLNDDDRNRLFTLL